jgi:phosphoribosylamine--glycine ligase
VVLKADGLAAGKGVVIAETAAEATRTLQAMFSGELVGQAGSSVVIEEFLSGDEVSFLALCDGQRAIGLVPAQDHKRVFDGDRGPNTGGMGAYSTDELLSPVLRTDIESRIVNATLNAMRSEGTPFAGVLYCGLMLTRDGPRVLEYNVRFGDPETQAIMLRFEGDLTVALASAATGELNLKAVRWSGEPSACVVVASGGYPGKYATGVPIEGVDRAASEKGMVIFHAGTKRVNGRWQTAGGRVLGVSARGQSLSDALKRCYNAIEQIHFDGMHYRHDIGARALSEHSFTQRHGERRERKTHSLP